MKNPIIYLTGFMASGKSTVGPILANTIGWNFADIDRFIESREGKKITEIFAESGEEYFRKIESVCLEELSKLENYVISLGGGTIADENNLKIIKNTGLLIYLKSSTETAYNRLRFKRDRPALLFDGDEEPTKEEFTARINELLNVRKSYYEKSDYIINTDKMAVGKTVDRLAAIIKKEITKYEN